MINNLEDVNAKNHNAWNYTAFALIKTDIVEQIALASIAKIIMKTKKKETLKDAKFYLKILMHSQTKLKS